MPVFIPSKKKLAPEDKVAMKSRFDSMVLSTVDKEVEHGQDDIHMPRLMQSSKQISAQAAQLKKVLEVDNSMSVIKDGERARLSKRMAEIADYLRKYAPTYAEVHRTIKSSGHADFEKAVQKAMFWQSEKTTKMILEWKEIKNKLEPEDPNADDVELLSSTKSKHYIGGRSRASK